MYVREGKVYPFRKKRCDCHDTLAASLWSCLRAEHSKSAHMLTHCHHTLTRRDVSAFSQFWITLLKLINGILLINIKIPRVRVSWNVLWAKRQTLVSVNRMKIFSRVFPITDVESGAILKQALRDAVTVVGFVTKGFWRWVNAVKAAELLRLEFSGTAVH